MADVLGTFEQAVLLSVLKLRDEAYGRSVLRAVGDTLQRDVSAGAVYATLERLEGKGMLRSRLGEGTPVRDGRPRKYYKVTRAGVEALNDTREALEQIWKGASWPLPWPA